MGRRRKTDLIAEQNSDISLLNRESIPYEPYLVGEHYSQASRSPYGNSNSDQSTLTVNGELNNLVKGISPFKNDKSSISVSNAIHLCQKAYWNVPIFRSTIDIQSQFANSKLYFKGSNKKSVKLFETWYKKIEGFKVSNWFFTEWFRSGNVFMYRFDGEISFNEYRRITRASEKYETVNKVKKIPIKYTVFDPGDMRCEGAASFINASYSKAINPYELSRLRNPSTPEETTFFESLPEETRKEIISGATPTIKLDQEKLTAIFCGRQPYEPMAVPMYYPVLTDIDLKLEFKKVEKIIARTVDYSILLITAGSTERDALPKGMEMNGQLLSSLKDLFDNESVGRVLVSDYTTKGEFIIPDLNKIFGEEKYRVVNSDIANGLMNIFWGEEKFANSMVKIKVFLERLNSAREAYLNEFLIPEMERVAKSLGMSDIPKPCFENIDLKDEIEYLKIYTRLAEIGVLTPDEMFEAFETQSLPLPETSVENQKALKKLKNDELYTPLAPSKQAGTEKGGRPKGAKSPQSTKKVGPIGKGSETYSINSMKDTITKIEEFRANAEDKYKSFNGLQRLSKKHKDLVFKVCENVLISEPPSKWSDSFQDYVNNPVLNINEQFNEISDISEEHGVDLLQASILFHSRNEIK